MSEHNISRRIDTEELAERVLENLDDFYQGELITGSLYEKKKGFTNVLRAINHADRITARDMNLSGQVVLYVPADTNQIIFSQQKRYIGEYIDSIDSQQNDLIDRDHTFFLLKDQYLDILKIKDRYLYVYDEYPIGGGETASRIKKVSPEEFSSQEDEFRNLEETYWSAPYYEDTNNSRSLAYFLPDEGRVVLNKKFKTPSFLKFNARLMPGVLSIRDLDKSDVETKDWDSYSVITPHWGMELLVAEAIDWLLPMSAGEARKLVKQEKLAQKEGFEAKKPNDSNVIVPHYSF